MIVTILVLTGNTMSQALRERKLEEAYQDWLRQVRDRAYVEIRLEEK